MRLPFSISHMEVLITLKSHETDGGNLQDKILCTAKNHTAGYHQTVIKNENFDWTMTSEFECLHSIMACCITSIYTDTGRKSIYRLSLFTHTLPNWYSPVHSPLKYSNKPFKKRDSQSNTDGPLSCYKFTGDSLPIFQSPRVQQISVNFFYTLEVANYRPG